MSYDALDDFAGPGGWDEGARSIGLMTLGFEWDKAACETAEAAGHARVRCDVSLADAAVYRGKVRGYIGSPPCTLFSAAGKGTGREALDLLANAIVRMFAGDDCRAGVRETIYAEITLPARTAENDARKPEKQWTAERVEKTARNDAFVASLVLEPARRILELDPEWIALEQVPAVLPLWQVYVIELRKRGYVAWTRVLNSADYGVPQTRERACLGASRVLATTPPVPTHSKDGDAGDLFGDGRAKWVSMASALGWDEADAIAPARGQGLIERHGAREPHPANEPAPTVIKNSRCWVRMGNQNGAAVRHVDEPAPTVLFGHRSNAVEWFDERPPTREEREALRFVGAGVTSPDSAGVKPRTLDEPAHALTGKGTAAWCFERPATTVVGSFKPEIISPPGYRTSTSRQNAEGGVRVTVAEGGVRVTVAEGGVRVTVAEGGVLQSFPADYPWQGSRTKQYQQVGNAIPPRLAAHVLAAVTGQAIEAAS